VNLEFTLRRFFLDDDRRESMVWKYSLCYYTIGFIMCLGNVLILFFSYCFVRLVKDLASSFFCKLFKRIFD